MNHLALTPTLFVLAMGCPGVPPEEEPIVDTDEEPIVDTDGVPPLEATGFPAFALGVEYNQPGLEDLYASTGVVWSKPRLESLEWGESQPTEGAAFDWGCTDAHVVGWQAAGIPRTQAYLSPRSAWGSVDAGGLIIGDVMPDPAHLVAFRGWVRALVERYDGDGVDDAPGLVTPVRHWVVGPEWTGFWPSGDHEDYLLFAEIVREEALAADPAAKLGTIPFLFTDEFAGNEPTDEEIEERMGPPYVLRNHTEGVLAILDRLDLFDYVNVHALGDYTEIPPLMRWLRAEMADRGHDKPVWIDDAFPAGLLANGAGYPALYPVTDANRAAAYELLRAIARQDESWDPPYSEARAWLRSYMAAGTVKKVITALGEGATGIQIGNTEDWLADSGPLRDAQLTLIGGAAAMGMVDVTHPAGLGLCDARVPGDTRPAFHALSLLVEMIGDGAFDTVERIGELEGARGYRLERDGASTWVVWLEDGLLHLPGEAPEVPLTLSLALPVGTTTVEIRTTPTAEDATGAATELRDVTGDAVELELTHAPMFVRAVD